MKFPKIYIDSEGVERGYYVYAHKCSTSGMIFYVGKGKEDRAWSDKRSRTWHDHVASINGKYDVILLHENLTEDESIDLERSEIEANGGASAEGGGLTNWIPGEAGNGFGVAIQFGINLGNDSDDETNRLSEEARRLYEEARNFRKLSRSQIVALEAGYEQAVKEAFDPINAIHWEGFDSDKWETAFLISVAYSHHYEIGLLCRRIKNRKLRWIDFCRQVDEEITSFDHSITLAEHRNEQSERDRSLCRKLCDAQVSWSNVYAEGSFAAAEQASDNFWVAHRFPPGAEYDVLFEQYIASMRHFFGNRRADAQVRKPELSPEQDTRRE
jgi:hypothetical protein